MSYGTSRKFLSSCLTPQESRCYNDKNRIIIERQSYSLNTFSMIRETRRLCLLFALVIGSKLCLFHKEVAIDEQNSWTGLESEYAFPFMVASWTTGSKISIRPRTFSTNSKHPAGLTPLYSSATTTESIVNGSESMKAEMFQPTVRIHRLPSVCRVHCISDLHVDNAENMKWLESRCRTNSTVEDPIFSWDDTDLIIVAGDISHSLTKIEDSLALLKETGAHVVFVPGNHEAWLSLCGLDFIITNFERNL